MVYRMNKMRVSVGIHMVLSLILLLSASLLAAELITYPTIPGRAASDQYRCRVRLVGSDEWKEAFVLQTTSKPKETEGEPKNGYTDILTGWSASWINLEMDSPVEVEISTVSGEEIRKAKVRPEGKTAPAEIKDGKAYVCIDSTMNISVDINGQMEDQYTGMGYEGGPVHTISLFANPIIADKPDTTDQRVYTLNPGVSVPDESQWEVLYFKPGVHNIGLQYVLHSNKTLYIPGDAVVHGTIMTQEKDYKPENIRIYGYGALSSENIARINDPEDRKPGRCLSGVAANGLFEGITFVDPSYHTIIFNNYNKDRPNTFRNLKILGWRVNGDGIHAFQYALIDGCFVRTQDDSFYYSRNVHIRNTVIWNDFNGSSIRIVKGGENSSFTDIHVIYHRASWHYWSGGRVISFRDAGPGKTIEQVYVNNVVIEDPFPAFPPFYLTMDSALYKEGDVQVMHNIHVENVHQKAPAVQGAHDNLKGKPQNTILGYDAQNQFSHITFKNCNYGGTWLKSFDDGGFLLNEYHRDITFISDSTVSIKPSGSTLSNELQVDVVRNHISYSFTENATVSVEFFNLLGKSVYRLSDRYTAGTGVSLLNISHLAEGAYMMRVKAVGENKQRIRVGKIIIGQ